jgi:hypothetical protein
LTPGLDPGIGVGGPRAARISGHPSAALAPGAEVRADAEEYRQHGHPAAVGRNHAHFPENEQVPTKILQICVKWGKSCLVGLGPEGHS